MNNWGNEYTMPPNQYGIPGMPSMNPMMGGAPNMIQPLMPPMCMMSDIVNPAPPVAMPPQPLIGPVIPESQVDPRNDEIQIISDMDLVSQNELQQPQQSVQVKPNNHGGNRDRRNNRRDQDHERDHSRRRSRSPSRFDRNERGDRNRNDRGDRGGRDRNDRSRRERPSKWGKNDNQDPTNRQSNMGIGNNNNMMMPAGIMHYNMISGNNMMPQQQMEIGNMQNLGNMSSMGNIQNMLPGMNMMQNIMPNMLDPMMMMNQQLPIPNQPMFLTNCVLLPPNPGTSFPKRREKPSGCRTIFVGGLPHGISEEVVHEIFQRFGGVDDIKLHRQGVCHVRFENHPSVEQSFFLSGYRFKLHDQADNEATTLFIDYALNRDDQNEFDRMKRQREPTPPRIEPFTPANLTALTDKIKSDEDFVEAAPTLLGWLERGECNKKNANSFYSLIQATNNQVRRLFNEKMTLDDEYQALKNSLREKFAKVILQFEQVAKILTVAKHQRVSDHFTKQQRRNIEMWLKMTEELENIKEEFNSYFDEEDTDKPAKGNALQEKYEELKKDNENLMFELEGYRNEAHLAKDEAERKFEKFKAQFIAQQALQNPGKQIYPPLPPPPISSLAEVQHQSMMKAEAPPPTPDDFKTTRGGVAVMASDAKLISMLTAFLLVHPLGATQDYLVSYVRSMLPHVTQAAVHAVLQKHGDVFRRKTKGVGPSIEHRWEYVLFGQIKQEY